MSTHLSYTLTDGGDQCGESISICPRTPSSGSRNIKKKLEFPLVRRSAGLSKNSGGSMKIEKTKVSRFWSHVEIREPTECWPWRKISPKRTVTYLSDSEGRVITRSIPRAAWILSNKRIIPKRRAVSSICDSSLCCNPAHLYVQGTVDELKKKIPYQHPDKCWEWLGSIDSYGYGRIIISRNGSRTQLRASRLSWVLHNKRPIPRGLVVCHSCDNPLCINPHHLWVGTIQDNNNDKASKNRSYKPIGELHPQAKLTREEVNQIRELRANNKASVIELSHQFGVSRSQIYRIILNQRWVG